MATATTQDPQVTADNDATQALIAGLRLRHFKWEGNIDGVRSTKDTVAPDKVRQMGPDYALHCAVAYGFGALGNLHLKRGAKGAKPQLSPSYYLTPEQLEEYAGLVKGAKLTPAKHSAAIAQVLGYTTEHAEALRLLASKRSSKAAQDCVRWTTLFLQRTAPAA